MELIGTILVLAVIVVFVLNFGKNPKPTVSENGIEKKLKPILSGNRKGAIKWMAKNTLWGGGSHLVMNFTEQLDRTMDGVFHKQWIIGWGLTKSGKPYILIWFKDHFTLEEITVKEAMMKGVEKMAINFLVNPHHSGAV